MHEFQQTFQVTCCQQETRSFVGRVPLQKRWNLPKSMATIACGVWRFGELAHSERELWPQDTSGHQMLSCHDAHEVCYGSRVVGMQRRLRRASFPTLEHPLPDPDISTESCHPHSWLLWVSNLATYGLLTWLSHKEHAHAAGPGAAWRRPAAFHSVNNPSFFSPKVGPSESCSKIAGDLFLSATGAAGSETFRKIITLVLFRGQFQTWSMPLHACGIAWRAHVLARHQFLHMRSIL